MSLDLSLDQIKVPLIYLLGEQESRVTTIQRHLVSGFHSHRGVSCLDDHCLDPLIHYGLIAY